MPETEPTRHLPLEDLHEAAGARFGPFAGWRMPISYPPGVMREHQHTRAEAGLFDISHMQLVEIAGPDAAALLSAACPLDPAALGQGRSKYTLLLNEDAGIIDDLIVTRLSPERFMVVANAGNADGDVAHLTALAAGRDVSVAPLERVFLALQGPAAEAVLTAAGHDLSALTFMTAVEPKADWFVSRSGYTGEDGFELALPAAAAREVAAALLADARTMWVGLAARDSLRLEAGLCLHGQDIDETTDPVAARLMWAIPKPLREGGAYTGAAALARIRAAGPAERRVGLKPEGRQPVRAGAALFDAEGRPAGRVTSGGFGPTVGHPVAMGYVSAALAEPGTALSAEVRGNRVPVAVHPLPFTPHRYHKG
ncbi:glycine cleavage system aminomethyltransferase GcvT [Aquibium sp. A9E412]|uniref:glycine cleavage system aminomethyltransferase GcvT n=1 Tax=Aquibium sp. A9E412 TaxID=2976767 RepID=UPI0025B20A89|nr:glycine cleavage system aminomethyltransferase GcvT [Aquibium sp. A9E412]MDN2564767.1 glycine cleavage system aminomethyltransferase GcvT [Aquibium sp. A9E412]